MRKYMLVVLAGGLLLVVGVALFWLTADHDEAGPANALTPGEIAERWTLLFDGQTPKGWKIDGDPSIQDGHLVLGGDRATSATTNDLYEDFELQFDYRFLVGDEGLLEIKRDGSGSSYGLGKLTPKPSDWNRAVYTTKNGTSSLECKPFRKPLFQ